MCNKTSKLNSTFLSLIPKHANVTCLLVSTLTLHVVFYAVVSSLTRKPLRMSWLTGLAGKAEELLNKVDQTANASLNISTISEEGSAIPVPGNKKSPLTVSPPDPAR